MLAFRLFVHNNQTNLTIKGFVHQLLEAWRVI